MGTGSSGAGDGEEDRAGIYIIRNAPKAPEAGEATQQWEVGMGSRWGAWLFLSLLTPHTPWLATAGDSLTLSPGFICNEKTGHW